MNKLFDAVASFFGDQSYLVSVDSLFNSRLNF